MTFHYQVRPDGGGRAVRHEGEPPGTRLDVLLRAGLPPVKVGLLLGRSLCSAAAAAAADGAVHGDLTPADAWLTGDGVVSLGGFGAARGATRAPEGQVRGAATDRYGLGRLVAWVLLPGSDPLDAVPFDGAHAHDDAVAAFVMGADFGGLPPQTVNDLQWYILHLMSFDHAARAEPAQVEAALDGFATAAVGGSLGAWSTAAHRGAAGVTADRRGPPVRDVEDLGGPVARKGPLAGQLSFSGGGTRTMFWTRPDPAEAPPARPAVEPPSARPAPEPAASTRPAGEPPPPRSDARKQEGRPGQWQRSDLIALAQEASRDEVPTAVQQRPAVDPSAVTAPRPVERTTEATVPRVTPVAVMRDAPPEPAAEEEGLPRAVLIALIVSGVVLVLAGGVILGVLVWWYLGLAG